MEENNYSSPTINSQKGRLTTALMAEFAVPLVIFMIIFILIIVVLPDYMPENDATAKTPYLIFAGVAGIVMLSFVVRTIMAYMQVNKLILALEHIRATLGLEYIPNRKDFGQQFTRPIMGILQGQFRNKDISLYPASDFSRKNNNKPKRVTVFNTGISPQTPYFQVQKKTALNSFLNKTLGGFDYKDVVIMPEYKASVSKDQQISEILNFLKDDVIYDFTQLSGRNSIYAKNGHFTIVHDGLMYISEDYMPYLQLLSKIKT